MFSRRSVAVGVLGFVLASAMAALTGTATAHSTLIASCPGAGEVVSELTDIDLTFGSPLDATEEQPPMISLSTADGVTDLDIGPTAQTDVAKLSASVPTPPSERGVYIVKYQVLSFDGDLNDGGYQFTFDPDASSATNCETGDDGDGGSGAGGWILLGGGAAALLVVAYLLRPRPTTD